MSEDNFLYECKICKEDTNNLDDFISPCCCKGSVGHVHKSCLNSWLKNSKGTEKYLKCQDCHCDYKRYESIEENPRIEFEMTVLSIGNTFLSTTILLLLILAVGVSTLFCNIMLLIIYFTLIIAVVDNGNSYLYWIVIMIFLGLAWSNNKFRTFFVDLILILGYGIIAFDLINNYWESTKRIIKSNYLDNNRTLMFDNHFKKYVDGII